MRDYQENIFSRFEMARIISARAIQIAMGAPLLISLFKEELEKINYDPTEVARIEFEKKAIPIIVIRKNEGKIC